MPKKQQRRGKKAVVPPPPTPRKFIRWGESYTSLLLGVVVVVIGILFVTSIIKTTHHTQDVSSMSTVATPTPMPTEQTAPTPAGGQMYVVQPGDDLWHISEKFYHSGYYYLDIAKANNLANPSMIYTNDKLTMPVITPAVTATPVPSLFGQKNDSMQNQPQNNENNTKSAIGDSYIVQSGDDLWAIAVKAYGDGYRWVDIAKANNLTDPGLIFSGNTLRIPR